MEKQLEHEYQQIECRLKELLQESETTSNSQLSEKISTTVSHDPIITAVNHQALLSTQGGKRLRALLCLTSGSLTIPNIDHQSAASTMLDISCAIEIFQTAALVHDDIIDDSDLRRGHPSAHLALAHDFDQLVQKFYSARNEQSSIPQSTSNSLQSQPNPLSSNVVGNNLAIMLGDLLATQSVTVVSQACSRDDTELYPSLLGAFLTMQHEVEIGQIMDVANSEIPCDDPDAIISQCLSIFRWKTASYTTISPIEMGLIGSGLPAEKARDYALKIGTPLGIAFQLADDLIDCFPSQYSSGKPLGGDIREKKRTILLADALKKTTPNDHETLLRLYQTTNLSTADVETVIDIFKRSGAVTSSEHRIRHLWESAYEAISQFSADYQLNHSDTYALISIARRFIPSGILHIKTED